MSTDTLWWSGRTKGHWCILTRLNHSAFVDVRDIFQAHSKFPNTNWESRVFDSRSSGYLWFSTEQLSPSVTELHPESGVSLSKNTIPSLSSGGEKKPTNSNSNSGAAGYYPHNQDINISMVLPED